MTRAARDQVGEKFRRQGRHSGEGGSGEGRLVLSVRQGQVVAKQLFDLNYSSASSVLSELDKTNPIFNRMMTKFIWQLKYYNMYEYLFRALLFLPNRFLGITNTIRLIETHQVAISPIIY